MHPSEPETSRPANRLRFSLLALFLLMTLLCVLFAWLARPRMARVQALFHVGTRPAVLLGEERPVDDEEIRLFRQNQLGVFTSPFLIQAAIRDPQVAALPSIVNREDPVRWIAENLRVEFIDNSELMSLSMSGPEGAADDMRLIISAVSAAYLDEVVLAQDRRQMVMRDAMAKGYGRLMDELRTKLDQVNDLKKELAGTYSAEIELRELEIEALKRTASAMAARLEVMDVNSIAPPQIRLIQPAIVSPE